jgi:hypothetical protein
MTKGNIILTSENFLLGLKALSSVKPKSQNDRSLHGGILLILATKLERLGWTKRWLGHEPRLLSSVWLGGVHKERMTQVHRACPTRCEYLATSGGRACA